MSSVFGDSANDFFYVMPNTQYIDGGAGDDLIQSGQHTRLYATETLHGGAGADTFSLLSGTDNIIIDDFDPSKDRLILDTSEFDSYFGGNFFWKNTDGDVYFYNKTANVSVTLKGVKNTSFTSKQVVGMFREGTVGADVVSGDAGDDSISGHEGNDSILGGWGYDTIEGGSGADTMDGGGQGLLGGDVLSYQHSGDRIKLDMAAGKGYSGDAEGDVFMNFEKAIGSAYADTITGFSSMTIDGGDGNDWLVSSTVKTANTVIGGAGADTLGTGSGDDCLVGGDGADYIVAEAGSDQLYGGAGDDTLLFGSGNDTVYGGDGNDYIDDGGDVVLSGADALYGGAGNDSIWAGLDNDTVEGGEGADTLDGESGVDLLSYQGAASGVSLDLATGKGYAGDAKGDLVINFEKVAGSAYSDTITGFNGMTIDAGDGNDWLVNKASTKSDTLIGGNGADTLWTGSGDDCLVGGDGADYFLAEAGSDQLDGGSGDDTLFFGAGNDTVYGGDGNDYIDDGGNVVLSGANALYGGAGNDSIWAGLDNDTVEGGIGADTLDGEGGVDLLSYQVAASGVSLDLATGKGYAGDAKGDFVINFEKVAGSANADTITGFDGMTIDGGDGDDWLVNQASTKSNTVIGGKGADTLWTGSGNDCLVGGDGADYFLAEAGSDQLYGGAGDDILYFGAGNDTVYGGDGNDLIDDAGWGIVLNGSDALYGGAGDDYIRAGLDNDTVDGGSGADTLDGEQGVDLVSYQSAASGIALDAGTGVGSAGDAKGDFVINFEMIAGSSYADTITGFDGMTIDGGDGDDRLVNQASTKSNTIIGGNGADTLWTGSGNDCLVGGDGADYLVAGAGSDQINGGSGDDTIQGGAGADTIDGGAGFDVVSYASSSAAVSVNLIYGAVSGGDAEGDKLSNIDGIVGSKNNDVLGVALVGPGFIGFLLDGGAGDDTLLGSDAYGHLASSSYYGGHTFIGGDGRDSIFGSFASDVIYGGAGNDTITSHYGSDTVYGGDGDDYISQVPFAYEESQYFGSDVVYGGDGNDTIIATSYYQIIEGGAGADYMEAHRAITSLSYRGSSAAVSVDLSTNAVSGGDAQGDRISGFDGVIGSAFGDTLIGTNSNNTLNGGDGNDVIDSGGLQETEWWDLDNITGGRGDDTLTGGNWVQNFIYDETSFGRDVITDFQSGVDKLQVSKSVFADWSSLLSHTSYSGADGGLVISYDASDRILLKGVAAGGLKQSDVTFY